MTKPALTNKVSLVFATSQNGIMGKGNSLPWNSKSEMANFKERTTGHTVVMGRGTWESIGSKPLSGRVHIIVSATLAKDKPSGNDVVFVSSLDEAREQYKVMGQGDFIVIGGARLLEEAYMFADTLEVSEFHRDYEGDVPSPNFDAGIIKRRQQGFKATIDIVAQSPEEDALQWTKIVFTFFKPTPVE